MNILICNERLLFRFGVDRLLLILAENLRKQGHHVTVIANNFNESVVKNAADQIYRIPDGAEAYIQLDTFTSKWIDRAWDELFWKSKPDVAIIGGWPFFSTIPVLEKHNCRTLFIDCGSVPLDGFEGHAREIQLYLKELRKKHLPSLTKISPISQFIATSQSVIDAPRCHPKRSCSAGITWQTRSGTMQPRIPNRSRRRSSAPRKGKTEHHQLGPLGTRLLQEFRMCIRHLDRAVAAEHRPQHLRAGRSPAV